MKIGVVVDHVFTKIKFTHCGLLACTKIYFACQFQGNSPPPPPPTTTKRERAFIGIPSLVEHL